MNTVIAELEKLGSPEKAKTLQRFFKTGPGEYGEGDRFLGVPVPASRKLARRYKELPDHEIIALLESPIHEARLIALLIWVHQYANGAEQDRRRIYRSYLAHTDRINNWDLVDLSAYHIVGPYLESRGRRPLLNLARSSCLWERRIAIIATFHFIRRGDFKDTLAIADILLHDEHDLIHKAVGWMLREVGKRDRAIEEAFLKPRYYAMPRTMLRYAIEKFPEPLRKRYLSRG